MEKPILEKIDPKPQESPLLVPNRVGNVNSNNQPFPGAGQGGWIPAGPGTWTHPRPLPDFQDPFGMGHSDLNPFGNNPFGMIGGPFGNERGGNLMGPNHPGFGTGPNHPGFGTGGMPGGGNIRFDPPGPFGGGGSPFM